MASLSAQLVGRDRRTDRTQLSIKKKAAPLSSNLIPPAGSWKLPGLENGSPGIGRQHLPSPVWRVTRCSW